jgi:hypothetical protein
MSENEKPQNVFPTQTEPEPEPQAQNQNDDVKKVYLATSPVFVHAMKKSPKLTESKRGGTPLEEFKAGRVLEANRRAYKFSGADGEMLPELKGENKKIVDYILSLVYKQYPPEWLRDPANKNKDVYIPFTNNGYQEFVNAADSARGSISRSITEFRNTGVKLTLHMFNSEDDQNPVISLPIFSAVGVLYSTSSPKKKAKEGEERKRKPIGTFVVMNRLCLDKPMTCNYPQGIYYANSLHYQYQLEIAQFLCLHQSRNAGKPNEYKVRLSTIIEHTSIPYKHELKNNSYKDRIYTPLADNFHPVCLEACAYLRAINEKRNNEKTVDYIRGVTSSDELNKQLKRFAEQLSADGVECFLIEFDTLADRKRGAGATQAQVEKNAKEIQNLKEQVKEIQRGRRWHGKKTNKDEPQTLIPAPETNIPSE